jgi:hypothetical protein
MITEEHVGEVVRRIFEEMKLAGPSVDKPSVEMTPFGARVSAGNLILRIYGVGDRKVSAQYYRDVAGAKDFSKGLAANEYYVRQGMFKVNRSRVGWFATAKNRIIY